MPQVQCKGEGRSVSQSSGAGPWRRERRFGSQEVLNKRDIWEVSNFAGAMDRYVTVKGSNVVPARGHSSRT
eukprot:6373322-Prymnesium_polylepis.1